MSQHFRVSSLVPSGFVVEHLDLGPDRVGVVVRSGAMAAPVRPVALSRGEFTADIFAERPICRFPGAALICG